MHYCIQKSPPLDSSLSASLKCTQYCSPNYIFHFPNGLFPLHVDKNFVCMSHSCTHLDLITLVVFSIIKAFYLKFTSASSYLLPLGPNILHGTMFSNTVSLNILIEVQEFSLFSAKNLISRLCEHKYCLRKSLIEKIGWGVAE